VIKKTFPLLIKLNALEMGDAAETIRKLTYKTPKIFDKKLDKMS